jgi:putative MATE family efflux protein
MTFFRPPDSSLARAMLALALPVMAEEIANLCVGYVDWYLCGTFLPGASPKAAMSLVAYSLWLIPTLFATVAIGAHAVTARLIGAGDRQRASDAANQSLLLGLVFSAVASLAVWWGSGPFVQLMQLEPEAASLAERYLRIMAPVTPLVMFEQVASACLRGAGDTTSGFLARVVVNILNALFSAGLVTGWGPLPELGWDGLAIGTAIGHCGGGMLLLLILVRGRRGLKLRIASLAPQPDMMRRVLWIGTPGGVDQLSVLICHLAYASIVYRLGTEATAAHGMAIQIEALSYLTGVAFMVAAGTLAGQSLGNRDATAARRSILLCWTAAVSAMLVGGAILYFFGGQIAQLFNGGRSSDVTKEAGRLLQIVAFGSPFHATLMVLTGALRGAGDTRWPLVVTFAGLIGVRLPLAVLLSWPAFEFSGLVITTADLGVAGAWYAMVADIVVRALLLYARFAQGGWQRIEV